MTKSINEHNSGLCHDVIDIKCPRPSGACIKMYKF